MASKYWLKLYHEILDDPKVMQLRPALRWRFVETLCVAGEMDEDGYLPDIQHYAWRIRDNVEVVETEFVELSDAGLLSRKDGRWIVTRFAERQAPVSAAERMRQLRKRQQKDEYYGDDADELPESYEDVTNRNTEKIREDKDEEYTPTPFSELSTAFCNMTGIPELTGGAIKWNEAIKFMVSKGITVQDMQKAYDEVHETYHIVGPWSLKNPALIAMSRRKKQDERREESSRGYSHG